MLRNTRWDNHKGDDRFGFMVGPVVWPHSQTFQ